MRFTGEEVLAGCLPKDKKDEMLRLAGMMGRVVAAGLGGEERKVPPGGKREESILLDYWGSAYHYSRTGISLVVGMKAWTSHRFEVDTRYSVQQEIEKYLWHEILNSLS